jgi:DNA-binding MarR family transcriptional regulator
VARSTRSTRDKKDRQADQAGLAFLTIRLIGRLRAHHVGRLAEFGLSIPEANVLLNLHPGKPMAMRQLADLMAYDKSNLTGVMRRLEAHGLVTADASATDRRVRSMVLTPAGEQLRGRLDDRLSSGSPLLAGLDAGERDEMLRLLRKLQLAESRP